MTQTVSDTARAVGDRVETFVRNIIVPYERDPRA